MTNEIRLVLNLPEMEPREFCKLYLARSPYEEEEWGYRAKCVRFLAQVLDVAPLTIDRNWGYGLDFGKTPTWAKRQLSYLHRLAQLSAA